MNNQHRTSNLPGHLTMKNIVLLDPYWEGHHQMYLKLFAKTLLDLGNYVTVFCPKPAEVVQWVAENCQAHANQLHAFAMPETENSRFPFAFVRRILNTVKLWKTAADAIHKGSTITGMKTDFVFFAWLDCYLSALIPSMIIKRMFHWRWAGLYFHPVHFRIRQRYAFFRKGLLDHDRLLSSENCCSVAVLDEGISNCLQQKTGKRPVIVFPDLADFTAPDMACQMVTEIREKARGRKIIALAGSLEKRKGLLLLMELAQKTQQEDWFYIFCGKLYETDFTPEERRHIAGIVASSPANCYFNFDYIPNAARFNALIDLCDVLFAVYENFYHSSNMLTLAAHFRKWILVSKGFCMDERVRRFQLGFSVDGGDFAQCYEALQVLLNHPSDFQPNFGGFLEHHSEERLCEAFTAVMVSL